MKLTCTIYVYKKKDGNNNNIFSDSNNNHRRYLQKRSTLLQNNDDCLNIAIKTLIGQIGELIRFAFFSNEQDYYKNYYKIFHNLFFPSNCCASIHASATQLS